MKRAWIIYTSIALASVLLCVGWARADESGRMRGEYADKLTQDNDEEIAFYASGLFGKRLTIVPQYADHEAGGQAECDAIIDSLLVDRGRMAAVLAKGFTSIQCGAREVNQ
jgi:hypothetical protein